MQFHFHSNQTHFHKNGFALALKQRYNGTRKLPITFPHSNENHSCVNISGLVWLYSSHTNEALTKFWEQWRTNRMYYLQPENKLDNLNKLNI